MDQKINQILFALIGSALYGRPLDEAARAAYRPEMTAELWAMAEKHDIAPLLAVGLEQNSLPQAGDPQVEQQILKAVYRYEQLNYDYGELCDILESAAIPFLPLKGAVLRDHYPEPWLRTSCDIDILVHEENVERAVALLLDEHGYTFEWKGPKDVSLFTPAKKHIELHYSLMEDDVANASAAILLRVWDKATTREGYGYWYEMPDDLFYYYHIAHMAKHVENGGCGIRPLIDLAILDHMSGMDPAPRDALLTQGNLLTFARVARRLSRVWLDGEAPDATTSQLEAFILNGGVYGSTENRVTIQSHKQGGRGRYFLSRLFIPYDEIKYKYPVLEKHPWLTPFMELHRIGKMLFSKEAKRKALREAQSGSSTPFGESGGVSRFLEDIGLSGNE